MDLSEVVTVLVEAHAELSDIDVGDGDTVKIRLPDGWHAVSDDRVTRDAMAAFVAQLRRETPEACAAALEAAGGQLDFSAQIAEHAFRVNLCRHGRGRLDANLRRVRQTIPPLESLGVPPAFLGVVRETRGLVLVTGPTNSGKSTTLAAICTAILSTRHAKVVTIEDPIEYVLDHGLGKVIQREVGAGNDTSSFAQALISAVRQAPDVIMVGEIRDAATATMALEAAQTGHLVLSTLHTGSAEESIDRLLNMVPANEQGKARNILASVLRLVLCQALIVGTQGRDRHLACELLINTTAVAAIIRRADTHLIANTMRNSLQAGMCLLNTSLQALVSEGKINVDEALDRTYDRQELERALATGAAKGTFRVR